MSASAGFKGVFFALPPDFGGSAACSDARGMSSRTMGQDTEDALHRVNTVLPSKLRLLLGEFFHRFGCHDARRVSFRGGQTASVAPTDASKEFRPKCAGHIDRSDQARIGETHRSPLVPRPDASCLGAGHIHLSTFGHQETEPYGHR